MFGCFWPIFFFCGSPGVATLDGRSTPSDDKLTELLREVAKYLKIKDRTIYRLVAKRPRERDSRF